VRSAPDFKMKVKRIAEHARKAVAQSKVGSAEYITWLATACRTLFLCGEPGEAQKLRRDFTGEMRIAAIELYQRQEFDLSEKYCREYLSYDPEDFDIKFHLARNLSRLGEPDESLRVIGQLEERKDLSPFRKSKLFFAKARTYLEKRDLEAARDHFLKSLELHEDFLPALEGITEVLLKLDQIEDAEGFINRALKVSPADSFALSLKADILWRRGDHKSAIENMMAVVKAQPENASFLFRLGRFLHRTGLNEEAYEHFKRAKHSDNSFLDARLSFASVCIDLGRLEEAIAEIESLRSKGSVEKRAVLAGIEAGYWLALGDLEKASELADKNLAFRRNVATLGMMAKIYAAKARTAALAGLTVTASAHRASARKLIEEGLALEPTNAALRHQLDRLDGEDGLASHAG